MWEDGFLSPREKIMHVIQGKQVDYFVINFPYKGYIYLLFESFSKILLYIVGLLCEIEEH